MAHGSSNKKVANGLVAASCAAVLAVYTAGYTRTRDAADRLDARAIERRAAVSSAPPASALGVKVKPAAVPAPSPAVKALSRAGEPKATSKVADATPIAEPPAALVVTPVNAPVTAPVAAPAAPLVPAPVASAAPAASKPNLPPWRDGEYLGWGSSRHGDIQAAVVIAEGRIVSATIAQCKTMYSCYVIERLPPQPALRQSPDVDTISGASESSDAFYWAVMDALTKAK